jgi:SAM-dependent methyltransferase
MMDKPRALAGLDPATHGELGGAALRRARRGCPDQVRAKQSWEHPGEPDADAAHAGPVLAERNGFTVIDCAACGFAHATPVPGVDELIETYRHDYYAAEKPLYLQRTEEDRGWWLDVYGERLHRMEARLPAGERAVLDVGSGPGLFLDAAAARDWRTLGVEPSRQAAAHARGLGHDIREGFFDASMAASLPPVDAIHMALVLEHVPEPLPLLAAARRLLRPGGMLCVAVPNDFNPLQQAAVAQGLAPWWVAPPHHLNYFSPASLAGLIERAGFTVVERSATFPLELFLLMGDVYVGDDALGRACHGKRKAFETALRRAGQGEVLATLYRSLADQGLGREIVLYAQA